MGLLDWLPCCGPRERKKEVAESTTETTSLLAPPRDASIISAEHSYGAAENSNAQLTGEQRARIDEIGREVGSHMLHINSSARTRSPRHPTHHASTASDAGPDPSTSSTSSSRPSSPSPMRPNTSPPGGFIRSDAAEDEAGEGKAEVPDHAKEDEEGVVRKTVFLGGMMAGPRKVSGRGRGRGRGRGGTPRGGT